MLRSASWVVASTVAGSKPLLKRSEKGTVASSLTGGRLGAGDRPWAGIMDGAAQAPSAQPAMTVSRWHEDGRDRHLACVPLRASWPEHPQGSLGGRTGDKKTKTTKTTKRTKKDRTDRAREGGRRRGAGRQEIPGCCCSAVAFGSRLTNVSCHSVAVCTAASCRGCAGPLGEWVGGRRQFIHCPSPVGHPPIPIPSDNCPGFRALRLSRRRKPGPTS